MRRPKTIYIRLSFALLFLAVLLSASTFAAGRGSTGFDVANSCARWSVGADGKNLHFFDKLTDKDYCTQGFPFSRVKKAGKEYAASSVSYSEGRINVRFGESGISAILKMTAKKRYFVLEVLSVSGENAAELTFIDLPLTLSGSPKDPYAACVLALNLQTKIVEIPGPMNRLTATCYPRFGFAGAKVAIIGCPQEKLRNVMKEVVSSAKDLPHSSIGGPWAFDAEINRGSYLFNFGDVTEKTVDDWIKLIKSLGFNQLNFHGGRSFRFGDCDPNRGMYPRGFDSLNAVIDKLHKAGIKAGLHTYSFFIDKRCPWVTPVPDPRLGKDASFTLAEPVTAEASSVPVVEPTKDMSTTIGYLARNSLTLQIDDELIEYTGISKDPPYVFTGCARGACGTKPVAHAKGAKVYHLKECFGLFAPDGDSTLLAEVAAKTADAYNECGFDMIYLDALDGADILGGPENDWHYGPKFVFELAKRLKRPAAMEMSIFRHHMWYVRGRIGATDHPTRSYKRYIDSHSAGNASNRRWFLPSQLGWWALRAWSGSQGEPTFTDDIEYLCCKALATDSGLSLMGITPGVPCYETIFKRYEDLRYSGKVSEKVKAKLRKPGAEFTLSDDEEGNWQFKPIRHDKHKVEGIDGWSNVWQVRNKFERQPARLRIQALMSAAHDSLGSMTLADFRDSAEFGDRAAQDGLTVDLQPSTEQVKSGATSGRFTATNEKAAQRASWAKVGKRFTPTLDIGKSQALGVWVYGDGQGELLNLQLTGPPHISWGIGEHYITVDFTGWRYFELIEPEGERWANYSWPYGEDYPIYRESVNFGAIESLSLWYNNIPQGKTVTCYLSPIKALPLASEKLHNPSVTIGGRTITFPIDLESGCYIEFNSVTDCKLYGRQHELIREIKPEGDAPVLTNGLNNVRFDAAVDSEVSVRAYVSVVSEGKPCNSIWAADAGQ
ncbi:MAG: hypothetical protein M1133_08025 [Armatimonadetes bacterium]|nr:hypothetical protein [Armatimonadota bacterium]